MNNTDLQYLRGMKEELLERPATDEELQNISMALRTNVGANDMTEALDCVADIIGSQLGFDADRLYPLAKDVIYHGKLLNAKRAVKDVRRYELCIGAGLIDKGKFEEFSDMQKNGMEISSDFDRERLPQMVRTLKGLEFMKKKGLIPEDYFTTPSKVGGQPSLCYASAEQIGFYIDHGADVNAKDASGKAVLDIMFEEAYSPEIIAKVYDAEGKTTHNPFNVICEHLDPNYDYMRVESNEVNIENNIKNAIIAAKHDEKIPDNLFVNLTRYPELFEKHPELITVFRNEDALKMKQDMINEAVDTKSRRSNDYLQAVRIKMGKTGDSRTGEVTEQHKKVAKIQTEAAKAIMLQSRKNRDK